MSMDLDFCADYVLSLLTVDAHVVEQGLHKYTLEKDFKSATFADILPH